MITLEEAKLLKWGTFGKSGKDPRRMVTLDECDSDHLANIAINIKDSGRAEMIPEYLEGIKLILKSRKYELPNELFEI